MGRRRIGSDSEYTNKKKCIGNEQLLIFNDKNAKNEFIACLFYKSLISLIETMKQDTIFHCLTTNKKQFI